MIPSTNMRQVNDGTEQSAVSDDMVERVAKVISDVENNWLPSAGQSLYVIAARAAIDAMREPTEEMCYAPPWATYLDALETWQSMISAALKESPLRGELK